MRSELAVAEKIIHVSLKSSREVVARMIQMATEKLKRREWVHIYVGGCEARELAQITPELTASLAGLSDHIKLIPWPMTSGYLHHRDAGRDHRRQRLHPAGNIRDILRERLTGRRRRGPCLKK